MNVTKNDLSIWMDNTIKKEKWFVEPKFHVNKNDNKTMSVGILSPFSYDFSTIALGPLSIYHAINRDEDCPGIADRIFIYDP